MFEFLSALVLTTGIQYSLPVADGVVTHDHPTLYLQVAREDSPLYLWSSVSISEEVFVLGQRMHRNANPSLGFGYTLDFSPRISGFIEAGYKIRGDGYYDFANSEIAYTYLVSRHNVAGRPVPVGLGPNGNADVFENGYTFEIENSLLFNIGIEAKVTEALSLRFGYTVERADMLWEIYEPERKAEWDSTGGNCTKLCGYWMEYDVLRSDAFTFSMQYSF